MKYRNCLIALSLGSALVLCACVADAAEQADAKTAPVASVAPSPEHLPPGYVLVFEDQFNEPKLDLSKWWTRYIYNNGMQDTLNKENERYRENNNHVMTGSSLDLTARIKHDPNNPRFRYESGMVRSKMTFKYGYFEARVKIPSARGTWPAFWLNSDADAEGKTSWPPEIDILEVGLNLKDDKPNMMHIGLLSRPNKTTGFDPWECKELYADPQYKKHYYHAPFDLPDDYHVYALLWKTDDTATFFIDGTRICEYQYKWVYNNGKPAPYAHVLLNLGIGGQWAGRYGVDDEAFPQAMKIDYVRVYQDKDHIMTGKSTIGHDLLKQETSAKSVGESAAP